MNVPIMSGKAVISSDNFNTKLKLNDRVVVNNKILCKIIDEIYDTEDNSLSYGIISIDEDFPEIEKVEKVVKTLTFSEIRNAMCDYNNEHGITSQNCGGTLYGVVVFAKDSFEEKWQGLESRSYEFNNSCKAFLPNMCGNSVFASSLDGEDLGVKITDYMHGDGAWKVDYCYIVGEKRLTQIQG